MKLRSKVFLVTGILLGVFFLIIQMSLTRIIEKDFFGLEQREAEKNTSRVVDALQSQIDALAIKASDWAQWDDSYRFMSDHNEEYVQSNLQEEAFGLLQINLIVLLDRQGKIAFEGQVQNSERKPFSETFRKHIQEDVTEEYIFSNTVHKEIVATPEGTILYVAQPITSSDGLAPSNGFIVFGYFFTEEVIQNLSRITHVDIRSVVYDDQSLSGEWGEIWKRLSKENPMYIGSPKTSDTVIVGNVLVSDVQGDPVLFLRVSMAREVYQKGQASIILFSRTMILVIALFSMLLFFILDRLVLRKLSFLSVQVEKIRESGTFENPIVLPGKDEFSNLAERINEMLKTLHDMELSRKESEKRFRTVADSAPVMIWMSDIDKKCIYVNRVWLDFTGRSLEEELGMGWAEKIHPDDLKKDWSVFEKAFEQRAPFEVEYRMHRFDGTDRWLFMRGIPNLTQEGSFSGYLASAIDITERKETEVERQRYVEQVEKMNRIMVDRELKMIELKEQIKKLEGHVSETI